MKKIKLAAATKKTFIVTYKGEKYYRLTENEKIGIGALHSSQRDVVGLLHPIQHARTVGKTPSQFHNKFFYNRTTDYKPKKEKFDIRNIVQD